MSARFVIGIDLGTTHCALAYAPLPASDARNAGDTRNASDARNASDTRDPAPVSVLQVPQLVAQGTLDARPLLPSFLYLPPESEGPQPLPWDAERRFAVGEHARARGLDAPARLVASAKSWLSHQAIDRRGGVLPLGAPEDIEKISPVEASWRYLEHLGEAWDQVIAKGDPDLAFAQQEVMITVPASFDPAARDLTVEAAVAAGIEDVTLLEEPQAAVYAWIDAIGDGWRKLLKPGDVLLIADIGGGTTDFSAIAAVEQDGNLELTRIAVGDHILLGGDNMDLALAHVVRQKLEAEGKELDRWQMTALTHAARIAKERLLGDGSLDAAPIALAARGSKLLGGSLRTELTREELTRTLVDGFFPVVPGNARPATRTRAGLTQLGLPYAQDPAVTRHLAAFLGRQAGATAKLPGFSGSQGGALLHPTAILFNGGVLKGEPLRERLLATLNEWLAADGAPPVRVLPAADLDLAVARGAAAYGLSRHGRGLRIRGGTARAYYVGIEDAVPAVPGLEPPITALCVAPFGMEEGTEANLPPQELMVVVGEPVHFRFFGSSVRRDDQPGTELPRWKPGELEELSPIEVTLPAEGRPEGDVVPVHLHASITEIGTLLLEAIPTSPQKPNERWRVELSVRSEA
ncbi:Hsp70 family protein [Chondromyces apiculatus]|uniref:DnaK-related protein n=1 Tax=Chondromyces apiculatus DSM 436 TaxID=1192034 RepID=A0A017TJL1_9BACT|nr:Hsp70 family protein [Chondromyces apiculatus]EYF08836.1 DnaK-related protein [Chondromyces apiculatus DSM 436]